MEDFKKIIEPRNDLFIFIEYKDKKLSITGVDKPYSNGNCLGSCGQIIDDVWKLYYFNEVTTPKTELMANWDTDMVYRLAMIWELYHLNDMKAGFNEQELLIAKAGLASSDFIAKASFVHKNNLGEYGDKGYFIEVPEEELEFLKSLPDNEHKVPVIWLPD